MKGELSPPPSWYDKPEVVCCQKFHDRLGINDPKEADMECGCSCHEEEPGYPAHEDFLRRLRKINQDRASREAQRSDENGNTAR